LTVLFHCFYFLNPERFKYRSLSGQGYGSLVQVGQRQARAADPTLVSVVSLYLPILCDYLIRGERYWFNKMFRVLTVADYQARIALDSAPMTLGLLDL
jgi:hypothetical protein